MLVRVDGVAMELLVDAEKCQGQTLCATVYYESVGVINGVQHLPARFCPGPRTGTGLAETIDRWQSTITDQALAEPVTA